MLKTSHCLALNRSAIIPILIASLFNRANIAPNTRAGSTRGTRLACFVLWRSGSFWLVQRRVSSEERATLAHRQTRSPVRFAGPEMYTVALSKTISSYGISSFDTSAYYGPSEIILGTLLQDERIRSEFPRESYKIVRLLAPITTSCSLRFGTDDQVWTLRRGQS